ncbi:hypothetical protein HDU93_001250 [Gonapodya sp. JEL0774]|nr:hypothetical protein HDU93_001250 [Gonapodya sp. JEL0774]
MPKIPTSKRSPSIKGPSSKSRTIFPGRGKSPAASSRAKQKAESLNQRKREKLEREGYSSDENDDLKDSTGDREGRRGRKRAVVDAKTSEKILKLAKEQLDELESEERGQSRHLNVDNVDDMADDDDDDEPPPADAESDDDDGVMRNDFKDREDYEQYLETVGLEEMVRTS